jgi:hypothetical protein
VRLWAAVSINGKKTFSDYAVKTFNAVAAIAHKTPELIPAFTVTFMPTDGGLKDMGDGSLVQRYGHLCQVL